MLDLARTWRDLCAIYSGICEVRLAFSHRLAMMLAFAASLLSGMDVARAECFDSTIALPPLPEQPLSTNTIYPSAAPSSDAPHAETIAFTGQPSRDCDQEIDQLSLVLSTAE